MNFKKISKFFRSPKEFFIDAIDNRVKASTILMPEKVRRVGLLVTPLSGGGVQDYEDYLMHLVGPAGAKRENIDIYFLVPGQDFIADLVDQFCRRYDFCHRIDVQGDLVQWLQSCRVSVKNFWLLFSAPDFRYSKNFFEKLYSVLGGGYVDQQLVIFDLVLKGAVLTKSCGALKNGSKLVVRYSGVENQGLPLVSLFGALVARSALTESVLAQCQGQTWGGLELLLLEALHKNVPDMGLALRLDMSVHIPLRSSSHPDSLILGYVEQWDSPSHLRQLQAVLDALSTVSAPISPLCQLRLMFVLCQFYDGLLTKRKQFANLSPQIYADLRACFKRIFEWVDEVTVFKLRPDLARSQIRLGMDAECRDYHALQTPVHLDEVDLVQGVCKVKWFSVAQPGPIFWINGRPVAAVHQKAIVHYCAGHPFLYENLAWLPLYFVSTFRVVFPSAEAYLYWRGKVIKDPSSSRIMAAYLGSDKMVKDLVGNTLLGVSLLLRWDKKYQDAWVFIDKDDKADDNAEHFYRWIQQHAPEGRQSFFVLRRSCPDWRRLRAEGFQLIPFGGLRHRAALLHAKWLFSSHAAPFVVNMLPKKIYGDVARYRFCFLQHGVTKDDQSAWLNSRKIDLLVTAAAREFDSMTSGYYKYTPHEVTLTGFPRHDALVKQKKSHPRRIVIMPTWRLNLAGKLIGKTSKRELNPDFKQSDYFKFWNEFFSAEEIFQNWTAQGYEVVFVPHPNIVPYMGLFNFAPSLRQVDLAHESIQNYLVDSALLVTDYSSIAFEVAYLRRPVVYYQFDHEVFFSSHTYGKGYYDYFEDGFGPVAVNMAQLTQALEATLNQEGEVLEPYRSRIDGFFAHSDADNARRLYEAVKAKDDLITL